MVLLHYFIIISVGRGSCQKLNWRLLYVTPEHNQLPRHPPPFSFPFKLQLSNEHCSALSRGVWNRDWSQFFCCCSLVYSVILASFITQHFLSLFACLVTFVKNQIALVFVYFWILWCNFIFEVFVSCSYLNILISIFFRVNL